MNFFCTKNHYDQWCAEGGSSPDVYGLPLSAAVDVALGTWLDTPAQAPGAIVVTPRTSKTDFDRAALAMPVLILPAVQINIRAGAFPPKDDNGVSYLKIPLNAL